MNRKALIIGSAGSGESHLPGVVKDLEGYKSFFKSALGGAWREDEIIILSNPGESDITREIKTLKAADYSVAIFSGHGYVDGNSKSTIVELKNGVSFDSIKLRTGAPKHLLILDCCRVVITEVAKKMVLDEALAKAMPPSLSPSECRRYYDKRITECGNGLVVLFACSENQTAGDTSQGGRYSLGLMQSADAWWKCSSTNTATHSSILSVVAAHNKASESVLALSGNRQIPDIEKPRCEKYFPFAVIA